MWPTSNSAFGSNRSVKTALARERAGGERRDEFLRRLGQDAAHRRAALLQPADQVERLVGGDAAADDEQYSVCNRHGRGRRRLDDLGTGSSKPSGGGLVRHLRPGATGRRRIAGPIGLSPQVRYLAHSSAGGRSTERSCWAMANRATAVPTTAARPKAWQMAARELKMHEDPPRDTIFALSSGRPPAAIAVVRISGPRAGDALKALAGRVPEPRKAALARVRDPRTGEVIDEALALWFPAPNSETGEDIAELQTAWRPRGDRRGARRALRGSTACAGRGRRIHPPRLRERQARSHRGRGPGRSDRRRNRGAAPAGVPAAQGPARRSRRDLAHAADRSAGAGRGAASIFPTRAICRRTWSRGAGDRSASSRRDRRGARRRGPRRAAARRPRRGDRRAAQCRQVDAAQPHRPARGGDRVAAWPARPAM